MKQSLHLVALALLNLLFVGYLATKVSAVERVVTESRLNVTTAETPPTVDLRRATDIWRRVTQTTKTWTTPKPKSPEEIIKDLSEVISEVDGWIYVPEEQKSVDLIIQKELDVLRSLISEEITRLSKDRLEDQLPAPSLESTRFSPYTRHPTVMKSARSSMN
jgi:hypothetical protein